MDATSFLILAGHFVIVGMFVDMSVDKCCRKVSLGCFRIVEKREDPHEMDSLVVGWIKSEELV